MNNTQTKGAITEQKCFLKCLEMGFQISKPLFDNARYDFILDTGNNLLKIQVKTSHWKDEEHTAFCFNCYSQHSLSGGNKIMKYTNKEIDFFMTERDGTFYLYPAPENGLKEKTLRMCVGKNGQIKGIDFAKDFIFEEVIKDF